MQQRADQLELSLHPVRVLAEQLAEGGPQPEGVDHEVAALSAARPVQTGQQREVFAPGQAGGQREVVGDEASQSLRLRGAGVGPANRDRTGRGLDDAGDAVERGGLAAAVGAEEAEHLTIADRERHLVDCGEMAVALAQSTDLEGCREILHDLLLSFP